MIAPSLVLVALSSLVQAGVADRLAGYVDGCRSALLAGDTTAFSDLVIETESVSDTLEVRGWRGAQEGGLTVSLLRRVKEGRGAGVCDISFRPLGPSEAIMTQLREMAEAMAVEEMAKTPSKVELASAGQVILTCAGDRGMALFIDPGARGQGFAAQVATVPSHRMACGG